LFGGTGKLSKNGPCLGGAEGEKQAKKKRVRGGERWPTPKKGGNRGLKLLQEKGAAKTGEERMIVKGESIRQGAVGKRGERDSEGASQSGKKDISMRTKSMEDLSGGEASQKVERSFQKK